VGFDTLEAIGVVMRRARWFVTCAGRSTERRDLPTEVLRARLVRGGDAGQLLLFADRSA
jgi:predicted DNA-binding helix-hairpin-helix protein